MEIMRGKILVIEDERDIADLIAYNLEKAGLKVLKAPDGEAGLRLAEKERPDAVVLDLMLPGVDGLEVCRRLRASRENARVPILMLTAKSEEADRVLGLELGADDYLPKPFSNREMVARVRALVRRQTWDEGGAEPSRHGALEIDLDAHAARWQGKDLGLTALEFKLLRYLASRPGRAVGRDTLLQEVWNADSELETRTVDVHVRRLREKLGKAGPALETLRGVGYKFNPGRLEK